MISRKFGNLCVSAVSLRSMNSYNGMRIGREPTFCAYRLLPTGQSLYSVSCDGLSPCCRQAQMAAYVTLGSAVRPERRTHSEGAGAAAQLELGQKPQARALRLLEQAGLVTFERASDIRPRAPSSSWPRPPERPMRVSSGEPCESVQYGHCRAPRQSTRSRWDAGSPTSGHSWPALEFGNDGRGERISDIRAAAYHRSKTRGTICHRYGWRPSAKKLDLANVFLMHSSHSGQSCRF